MKEISLYYVAISIFNCLDREKQSQIFQQLVYEVDTEGGEKMTWLKS
ncbi:MAG: hypothetical protein ACRC2R_01535 [Xenococcaceae cyanobacterium]